MTTNEAPEQPFTFLEDAYERSHRRLRTVAARYVPNDAEDVVHDAFVRALEGAASFRHNATPHTWLHRRAFRSHVYAPDLFAGAIVRAALKSLSPFNRRLCVLRFVYGYSYREIANRLGMPEGTVKSRVSHARARLRDEVSGRLRTTHERRVTLRKRARSSRLNPNVA
jgi:RNA polymerase sigma-70 factor (ECF subfamily)